MLDNKFSFKNLKSILPKSKSSFLIIIGIIGLMLVLVSTFNSNADSKKATSVISVDTKISTDEYVLSLERRLEAVISDMLDSSQVTVMVTLETGREYVYANETKTDAGTKKDQGSLKTEQSDSNENTYVVMKDANGNEQPLIVTEKMPIVRGVVVVCDSGQTSSVAAAVRLAVRSALNISDEKICVVGRY